jgi:hypothetical protein
MSDEVVTTSKREKETAAAKVMSVNDAEARKEADDKTMQVTVFQDSETNGESSEERELHHNVERLEVIIPFGLGSRDCDI